MTEEYIRRMEIGIDDLRREREALEAENEKLKKEFLGVGCSIDHKADGFTGVECGGCVSNDLHRALVREYELKSEVVKLKKDLEEAVRIAKHHHGIGCNQCFKSGVLREGSRCIDGIFLSRFPVQEKGKEGLK